jgi:hypothetical protein
MDAIALAKRMERIRKQNAARWAGRNPARTPEEVLMARTFEAAIKLQADLEEALEFQLMVIECMMRAHQSGGVPTWALPIAVYLEDLAERDDA